MEHNFTKSTRKFIRSEKARIRAQFFDFKKQEELISELYRKLLNKKDNNLVKQDKIKEIKIDKKEVKKPASTESSGEAKGKKVKSKIKK